MIREGCGFDQLYRFRAIFQLFEDLEADLFVVPGGLVLGGHDGEQFAEQALGRKKFFAPHAHLFDGRVEDRLGRVDLFRVLRRSFMDQKLLGPVDGFREAP